MVVVMMPMLREETWSETEATIFVMESSSIPTREVSDGANSMWPPSPYNTIHSPPASGSLCLRKYKKKIFTPETVSFADLSEVQAIPPPHNAFSFRIPLWDHTNILLRATHTYSCLFWCRSQNLTLLNAIQKVLLRRWQCLMLSLENTHHHLLLADPHQTKRPQPVLEKALPPVCPLKNTKYFVWIFCAIS